MSLKAKVSIQRVLTAQCGELKDKTVSIRRVAKVVKGGRRFGFSALVVTGDARGHVGYGLGKSAEVPDAIRKAGEKAKKNVIRVPMKGSTLPFQVVGKFGPTEVLLKPAYPGTGVIAGSTARAILEAAGVKDVYAKIIGSSNAHNVLYATFDGLLQLKDPEIVASLRGRSLEEIGYTNP